MSGPYPLMASTTPEPDAPWAQRAERGNRLALKLMAFVATVLGRRMARLLLHPIAAYFVLFAPSARRHSVRYLGRALGRPANWLDVYRHVHAFASTVLDRVYFARGQLKRFDIRIDGLTRMDELLAQGRGAVLLGAHLGSFEAVAALRALRPGLRVTMAMFADNARMIHATLQAIAPGFELDIVAIGRAGSTLALRDRLDAGGVVGILGDRFLHADTARGGLVELPFLGRHARFSDGPLRLALLLRQRVVFMAGLYLGGNRYHIVLEPLADFSVPASAGTSPDQRLRQALQAYVARLESLCRQWPTNWFNFFDFWEEDERH